MATNSALETLVQLLAQLSEGVDKPMKLSAGQMVYFEMEDAEYVGVIEDVNDDTEIYSVRIHEDGEPTDKIISIPFSAEIQDYDSYMTNESEPEAEDNEEQDELPDDDGSKSRILASFKMIEASDNENIGIIEGFASTYGNVDLGGDVVEKGAYTQTLRHRKGMVPLLLDHNYTTSAVAGVGYLEDAEEGLKLRGEMPLDVPEIASAYRKIKFMIDRGMKMGLSIGYDTIKSMPGDNGIRRLKELALHEVSITPFPMNTEAMIMSAKANKFRKFVDENLQTAEPDALEGSPAEEGASALLEELTQTLKTLTQKHGR
jgi:uncharacterized protein